MFLILSVTLTAFPASTVAVSAVAVSSISSSVQGPLAADVTNEKAVGVGLGVGEEVGTNGCGGSLEVVVGSAEFVAAVFCAPLLDGPPQAYDTMSTTIARPTSTTARRRQ
jgi:hypothetical protein